MATGEGFALGAEYLGGERCRFRVWAPAAKQVELLLLAQQERCLAMEERPQGYWEIEAGGILPGTRYRYRLDGQLERADPASVLQPEGVHGPSAVIDHGEFSWSDASWRGIPQEQLVIYELHVGTFTAEGTFDAVIPRLGELFELGVTAIELMPVAQFPGGRNWGYDGVYPFAVQQSYGGPQGLKRLVDACHRQGMAVILDVVYNHLGPEGNYLRDFGPYFTDRYRTPWGEAINFDGAQSDQVRRFFIANARHWFARYHIDGLRLDAVHAIYDFSATPFLQQLSREAAIWSSELKRPCSLIAESDLNDARLIRPEREGGIGLAACWSDDFHHALHTLLTGEREGYYRDFGSLEDLARAYRQGFVYDWRYSPFRRRHHGSSCADRPGRQLVVCSQNHDQVGNRRDGERLISLTGFEGAKAAAAAVLLAPFVPLLFMGEEYGERAPFPFFVSFDDPQLIEAVRRGRKEEFSAFDWAGEPPDPQDRATYAAARLGWDWPQDRQREAMRSFYGRLLKLRREIPPLAALDRQRCEAAVADERGLVLLRRWQGEVSEVIDEGLALFNLSRQPLAAPFPCQGAPWDKLLDSASPQWQGPGPEQPRRIGEGESLELPPLSCVLYRRIERGS